MENFRNDISKLAYDIFASTGKISDYLFYSAVEYDRENICMYADDKQDGGMEL